MSGASSKPVKRLWINSLEKEVIQQGLQDLKDGKDYYSLYKEAETRQKSDWLVGMNASRLYSILFQQKGLRNMGAFSVGRVQLYPQEILGLIKEYIHINSCKSFAQI